MPKLREVVDPDTGEVYHVETTRQAKRRHQRSVGVPKPTIGQINAADIWNKQEEKIKKDREREERKKKNKQKEEAKEARLKELQEEKLRLGRITIEDTWGKVNASQNRLHAFFGPPKKSKSKGTDIIQQTVASHQNESDQMVTSDVTDAPGCQVMDDTLLDVGDLEDFFTASPLSPEIEKPKCQRQSSPTSLLQFSRSVRPSQKVSLASKRKHLDSSATMMPPPKRLRTILDTSEKHRFGTGMSSQIRTDSTAEIRSPLSVITTSQMNIRANEKIDGIPDFLPVATQVVRDTLSALCSQDLDDDFADDKENTSPTESSQAPKSRSYHHNARLQDTSGGSRLRADLAPNEHTLSEDFERVTENSEDDDFDDEGIDDDALLALAATQQTRKEFLKSSKRDLGSYPGASFTHLTTSIHGTSPSRRGLEHTKSATLTRRLNDSFTMDDVSDEDLLMGLEVYESQARMPGADRENCEAIRPKSRRVLPWVKNPIANLSARDEIETLTPSPCSQPVEW